MYIGKRVVLVLSLLGWVMAAKAQLKRPARSLPNPMPAYPAALAIASVRLTDISNLSTSGLLVGNGELNAIIYSSGAELRLRLSKNDCWDMRVNTSKDAPLPVIDVEKGSFSPTKKASSWNDYSYPTALPCADVTLSRLENQPTLKIAELDLLSAKATVASSSDTTTIRVLNGQNVLLIEGSRAISFTGINQLVQENTGDRSARSGKSIAGWVADATIGAHSAYAYLHQTISGDADASGMDIYVVSGKQGTKQAIAVVTSRESKQPLQEAERLVSAALSDRHAVASHERAWREFWSKSGIQLSDTTLQTWWYRMLYFNRCFARSGGNAIGLQAAFDQLGGWHNSLKINYNIQQSYLAGAPANHPDLIEPFIEVLTRNLNRGKWFARTCFPGSEGAFFHSDLWPFEPDPAQSTTTNKHQLAYLPWGYSWGMAGHAAMVLWEYYTYTPTPATLNRIYPVLSQFALFYCSVLEKCPLVAGKRKIGPGYFPENGHFGQFNVAYDITFINGCLKAALQASQLKRDGKLARRITPLLTQLPTYSTVVDPAQQGTIVEEWLGAGLQKYDNHGTLAQAVFPANEITWFSTPSDKALYQRTINWIESVTGHVNSNVTLNVARARLGMGEEAIANAKMLFGPTSPHCTEQPNGLFYWDKHGYYVTEQVGIARLISELLLQSVGDAIRLFPAWPKHQDAQFSNLRTAGGFTISASQQTGVISAVTIHSSTDRPIQISNPWNPQRVSVVNQSTGKALPVSSSGKLIRFSTKAGESYLVTPTGL